MADIQMDEEKKAAQLVEYLQGPRRKRKNYVIVATGQNFDVDLSHQMAVFLRKNYTNLSLALPRSDKELVRLFSRQIMLLIIDDQFMPYPELCKTLLEMKTKQKTQNMSAPILFLTDRSRELIAHYSDVLSPYQEADDYIKYRGMNFAQISARIQVVLSTNTSTRRAKRFKLKVPVSAYYLPHNKYVQGEIVDMSVFGAKLTITSEKLILRHRDQLKVHLPVTGHLPVESGDFVRFSAIVRRVLMGGRQAAISWEHLSMEQNLKLTKIVISYSNQEAMRSGKS
ncbi:MAG: PilZ domain-containing protein [Zetaproteobacteria bacterium]|nr:PilZ domain-containing protein [Zetaproteobacteria bacterium]